MKKLFLSFLVLAFSLNLVAQSATNSTDNVGEQTIEKLAVDLKLNESQLAKVQKIKERKASQLIQIASLKETNSDAYYSKLKEIIKGNKVSFQMLLNKEQLKEYDLINRSERIARASKVKELKSQGLTRIEIERVLLEIDAE